MSHVRTNQEPVIFCETRAEYRAQQMSETRWDNITQGVSDHDLDNNFDFLNAAVLNRSADDKLLLTTTGLFGPIRAGTVVNLDINTDNLVVQSDQAPGASEPTLISYLNQLHDQRSGIPPSSTHALAVDGYWTAAIDGAGVVTDKSANVFGSTGQLICDTDELNFPLLSYGSSETSQFEYLETLSYYGGTLIKPGEEFALGFNQDLWGIQYDQKLPEYIIDYQFGATKGGGLFVEHHPFPHIWLPAQGTDPVFGEKTLSRILLGRRVDNSHEDPYFRTVNTQEFHFTMFEIPLDGSALAIRPQCIHNDSFTQGAQTVFLANTPANTVALRHSMPITNMYAGGVPVKKLSE
jgi:hypothetical protein